MKPSFAVLACVLLCCVAIASPADSPKEVQLKTSEQLTVYVDLYETGTASTRPLIILVHQGDGNAKGEYGPIFPRLRGAGLISSPSIRASAVPCSAP